LSPDKNSVRLFKFPIKIAAVKKRIGVSFWPRFPILERLSQNEAARHFWHAAKQLIINVLCFWHWRCNVVGTLEDWIYKQKKFITIKKHKIMKKLSLIFAAVFIFGVGNVVKAQDYNDSNNATHGVNITIPTVALVDVEGSDGNEAGTINLTPDVSGIDAGEAVNFTSATNSDLWLNYTSVVGSGQTRAISASITGTIPSGVSLNLEASSTTTGEGALGSVTGPKTLGSDGKVLVTGIGSGYTESGYEKGRQLTYSLDMDDDSYADLVGGDSYNVTVTFTITGDAE